MLLFGEFFTLVFFQLHSKNSGRGDSYVPITERSGHTVSKEYRESRVGDACFFIGKTLDRICEMDPACAQAINEGRQSLWPHYFARNSDRDADQEREKAAAALRRAKAKEQQRKIMEQMAQQRKRFMENMETSGVKMDDIETPPPSSSGASDVTAAAADPMSSSSEAGSQDPYYNRTGLIDLETIRKSGIPTREATPRRNAEEFTCCHCLVSQPASEKSPIGLVTLIQPTSVLAHKHGAKNRPHLVLPTSPEEERELPKALADSLGIAIMPFNHKYACL